MLKINTCEALLGQLQIMQFMFESKNQDNKQDNLSCILSCLNQCDRVTIPEKKWYRARVINENDADIVYDGMGNPMRGYLSDKSGVAPAKYISSGRANDRYEQVLYIAEDEETAQKEARADEGRYVSVASCNFQNDMVLMDFSPYTEEQLSDYANTNFSDSQLNTYMFTQIQKILTMPEYSEKEYIISRTLVKCIKENMDVSGILYISHFTGKKNMAIWDDNKFIKFTDGCLKLA